MLLALVVWLGGIIFFAFVVAPNLFSMLDTQIAGNVVRRDLMFLHPIGLASGLVFLICSAVYSRLNSGRWRPFALANLLVLLMLVFTLVQARLMPRMDAVRTVIHISEIDSPSASYMADQLSMTKEQLRTAAQADFDRLHRWSTRLEGGVLLLGLVVVGLTARRLS